MLGVLGQPLHQSVVETVGVIAQGLFPFEHDHGRAVGVEFIEDLADVAHRHGRWRVGSVQSDRAGCADYFQLWHKDIGQRGDGDPQQDDWHGQHTDGARRPGTFGRFGTVGTHADLSKQAM